VKQRVVPTAVVFVGVAVGVWLTALLALGTLRHIVIPILAVLVAWWLAQKVWHVTGGESRRRDDRSQPR
jgi:hypothetical protein